MEGDKLGLPSVSLYVLDYNTQCLLKVQIHTLKSFKNFNYCKYVGLETFDQYPRLNRKHYNPSILSGYRGN